jgi:serine/threonine protein kinase
MPQPIVQPLRRWDPERIGPYAIIGKLGAGAMGQVFLAQSTAGRLVAVKTIRIELAEEAGFRARFARWLRWVYLLAIGGRYTRLH